MQAKKFFTVLSFLLCSAAAVSAQSASRTQHQRIKQGVKSGELTRHETKTLVKQQKETRQDVRQAKADGIITPGEKKEIRQDKRKSNRTIYRTKHNNRDRN
ncbi:MAG: hypothetical protein JWQ27_2445 [Ferruginibacter sp.]|nr:hypothetical protein [Ferruginibacter sp.]